MMFSSAEHQHTFSMKDRQIDTHPGLPRQISSGFVQECPGVICSFGVAIMRTTQIPMLLGDCCCENVVAANSQQYAQGISVLSTRV